MQLLVRFDENRKEYLKLMEGLVIDISSFIKDIEELHDLAWGALIVAPWF
jgi:hypothetical protein